MTEDQQRDNVIHVTFGAGGGVRQRKSAPPVKRTTPLPPPNKAATPSADPTSDLYTRREAARLFGLKESRLRNWERTGVVEPSAKKGQRQLYSFQDLIGIRVAKGLLDRGIPLRDVRASVLALRRTLPDVTRPLSELRVVADGSSVLVRDDQGTFNAQTGQQVLDFQVETLREDVVRVLRAADAETRDRNAAYEAYLEGCRLDEDESTYAQAEAAYLRALNLDPSLANAFTNLGNLAYRRGNSERAENLYQKALEVDPAQPEALYNLGFLDLERNQAELAASRFELALESDPAFADAHFNLAMAYETLGRLDDARPHWETYLLLEPTGSWATIAHEHLLST